MKMFTFKSLAAASAIGLTLSALPVAAETKRVAIANFGEHPQLNAVVQGAQDAITAAGLDVEFSVDHVNFDATLLPQMLAKIEASSPDLVIGVTTPVAQNLLNYLGNSGTPILFGAVTDPVAAELVPSWDKGGNNITGVADALDIDATMQFINELFPNAKSVGVPYNPAEANDLATLEQVKLAAPKYGLAVQEVGVDNTNDIMARVTSLSARSDVLYGPGSNMIQPAIAAVASAATQAGVPVVNMDGGPVSEGMIPAGYTVSYHRIGELVGEMAIRVLAGEKPDDIAPRRPTRDDHVMVISKSGMAAVDAEIPASFAGCDCIVD
ncbi:ABC transporter substrate-binding protein [Parasedimentitalea huanghaiensis]|nr:ABC transporter substrate-binding protein [Zongyanglinia huanghaiensis]